MRVPTVRAWRWRWASGREVVRVRAPEQARGLLAELPPPMRHLRAVVPSHDRAVVAPMERHHYTDATFLDHRGRAQGNREYHISLTELMRAHGLGSGRPAEAGPDGLDAHRLGTRPHDLDATRPPEAGPHGVVLHTASCGSTLLCRLLDHPGSLLAYKEPHVYTQVADALRAGEPEALTAAVLRLARADTAGGVGSEVAVVKLSDLCANLAGVLADGTTRMLLLHEPLDEHLVGVLANPARRAQVWDRARRGQADLVTHGLAPPEPRTPAEAAALWWAAMMLPFRSALEHDPTRTRSVLAGHLRDRPEKVAEAAAAFFGATGPRPGPGQHRAVLADDAKRPGVAFDARRRREQRRRARAELDGEVEAGTAWLVQFAGDELCTTPLPHPLLAP